MIVCAVFSSYAFHIEGMAQSAGIRNDIQQSWGCEIEARRGGFR